MKFDILSYVNDNYICRCREHQPDTFFLIPKKDMNELGNIVLDVTIRVDEDIVVSRKWISVTELTVATDVARGDDFCIRNYGMTAQQMVISDYDDFVRGLETVNEEFDRCECCPEKSGYNYDTGEVICNHRCMFE